MAIFDFEITTQMSAFSLLFFGFLLGLKHATEADHLAAVAAMVSERRNLFSASLIGAVWGFGHTLALLFAGVLVFLFKVEISEETAHVLEKCVGVMIILLGVNALWKLFRGETAIHAHAHYHGKRKHTHLHVHRAAEKDSENSHHGLEISWRSLAVGAFHGLAGSAALMLLIVPTISSAALALFYIAAFGIGSIGGMILMSFLLGLPFHLTTRNFGKFNYGLRVFAALFGILFGFYYIFEA